MTMNGDSAVFGEDNDEQQQRFGQSRKRSPKT
jgi:hypothetical protein